MVYFSAQAPVLYLLSLTHVCWCRLASRVWVLGPPFMSSSPSGGFQGLLGCLRQCGPVTALEQVSRRQGKAYLLRGDH